MYDGTRTPRACRERFAQLEGERRALEGMSEPVAGAYGQGHAQGLGLTTGPGQEQEVNPTVIVGKKLKRNSEAYQKRPSGGGARKVAPGTPGPAGATGKFAPALSSAWRCRC